MRCSKCKGLLHELSFNKAGIQECIGLLYCDNCNIVWKNTLQEIKWK